MLPVETNIVVDSLVPGANAAALVAQFKEQGVLSAVFGPHTVRMVTHLGIDDQALEQALAAICSTRP